MAVFILAKSVQEMKTFVPIKGFFRNFRKSLKMCKMNHLTLFYKSCSVAFLTFIMALRFYAAPPQI